MRPILTLRPTCCQLHPRRLITTKPATLGNIEYELLNRPAKAHWDRLTPQNSNLLAASLNDYLPREAQIPLPPRPGGQRDAPPQKLLRGAHLVYFPPSQATPSLLPDGTDADHSPGAPFTRRLWAGGSVAFHDARDPEPALDGGPAVCCESVEGVRVAGVPPGPEARTGRGAPGAGEKIFVDLVRRYAWRRPWAWPEGGGAEEAEAEAVAQSRERPAVEERRTLCFMAPKTAEEIRRDMESPHVRAGRAPAYEPTYSFSLIPPPALLFRFSALTFNAHAIHLDRQHCREVEGYRNLLVHGPLLLTLMFAALRGALASGGGGGGVSGDSSSSSTREDAAVVKRLDYRNLAPVYVGEEIKVCVRQNQSGKWDVWVVGPTGGLCVKGSAVVGQPSSHDEE